MKHFLYLIPIVILLTSCSSDDTIIGSNTIITEARSFSPFNEIEISNDFNVVITHGDIQYLEVTASDNLIGNIITLVSNNKLTVKTRGSIQLKEKIGLNIVLPTFTKIELFDDVDCKMLGFDNMLLFQIVISDDCNLNISGSTKKLEVKVIDDSDLNGFTFKTEECYVNVSDDSKMSINCTQILKGKVFDDSKLFYTGNTKIDVIISDNGIVIDAN